MKLKLRQLSLVTTEYSFLKVPLYLENVIAKTCILKNVWKYHCIIVGGIMQWKWRVDVILVLITSTVSRWWEQCPRVTIVSWKRNAKKILILSLAEIRNLFRFAIPICQSCIFWTVLRNGHARICAQILTRKRCNLSLVHSMLLPCKNTYICSHDTHFWLWNLLYKKLLLPLPLWVSFLMAI